MDFSAIFEGFISPIIMIGCLCIGYVIKAVWKDCKVNRYIPLIVMGLGIVFNVWATMTIDFTTVVIGMVSGLASTGLYELLDTTIMNVQKTLPTVTAPTDGPSNDGPSNSGPSAE